MESTHGTTVVARQQVTPQMVRLTLAFDDNTEWKTTGLADEFVHVDVVNKLFWGLQNIVRSMYADTGPRHQTCLLRSFRGISLT